MGVTFTKFVELSEGDSEGVGSPKSEKSVPKICLTSDDKRSLLCSVDCFDFRLLASRGLFLALGSDVTLEFALDSSVPRSDNWSDLSSAPKEDRKSNVLFLDSETGDEAF